MIERDSERDYRVKYNLKLTERKRIVLCVAQRKNRKCDFSFTQDTQGR